MKKNDIKKIREYIACPQFGDNHYGKWGALRLEQRQKIKDLLDCITNLQEERNMFIVGFEEMSKNYFEEQAKNKEAVEYIENNFIDYESAKEVVNTNDIVSNEDLDIPVSEIKDLLDILRGEE